MNPPHRFTIWGTAEVCNALGITRQAFHGLRQRRRFPRPQMINAGRTAAWDAERVLTWIIQNKPNPEQRADARAQLKAIRNNPGKPDARQEATNV